MYYLNKIQMCSCAYVLGNLECPSATETHHLTHQKFYTYKGLQRKHFDSCGLFPDGGTTRRNLLPVLIKTLLPACVFVRWLEWPPAWDYFWEKQWVQLIWSLLQFSSSVTTLKVLKTSCSSVGTTWDFLKLHRKMRKTKKKVVVFLNCQLPKD